MSERKRKIRLDAGPDSAPSAPPLAAPCKKEKTGKVSSSSTNPWTGLAYSSRYHSILATRVKLPVYKFKEDLLAAVAESQVVVIEGETGSGKTTQIPQFLVEAGYAVAGRSCVACTQPRRVAATSVARRVSEEMDVELGGEVGYNIRFEDVTDPNRTVLKFLTDGMLLREAMGDPELSNYGAVILDEAHERTLATDVLMGLLHEILPRRPTLKLLVMSATLDAGKFQAYFRGAPIMKVPGRTFPVDIFYTAQPERNYVEAAVRTALHVHRYEEPGDILVFLTGEMEIETCCNEIRAGAAEFGGKAGEMVVHPLYSSLPPAQQQKIFDAAPEGGRKVVVSTNIAETSLTIDGIVYVIDPGFSKQKVYNPRIRVESLLVSPISRASARQRAGRAGRTRPGKCFRLYTEKSFKEDLQETTYPEILRSQMSNVVLTLKKLGIDDLVHFDYMDPPAPETLMRALEELNYLGALDDEGEITDLGYQMSELPLDPKMAKMLLSSPDYGCSDEIVSIVACLSAPQIFLRPKEHAKLADDAKAQFANTESDHITLLNAFAAYSAVPEFERRKWCWDNFLNERSLQSATSVRKQLTNIMQKLNVTLCSLEYGSTSYDTSIRMAVSNGTYMHVAYRQRSGQYLTVKDNQIVHVHPGSVVVSNPEWIVFEEFALTTKNFIRTCTTTRVDWLIEMAPHYFDLENFPECEAKAEIELAYRRLAKSQRK